MAAPMFIKCKKCGNVYEKKKQNENNRICIECGHYGTLDYIQRLTMIIDEESFVETNVCTEFYNPIDFPGYYEKHKNLRAKTDLNEAIVTGKALINGEVVMLGIMDTRYMMGSMGIIVGEKVTRLFEDAEKEELPVIIFTASGGARMQEGIFSLMQMAKTSVAISKFDERGGLYISVLTNPTTGGVSASFAFLGDIILAEPGALIGFAGKRVIQQTTKEQIPENYQTAEFLFENGYIDQIVQRGELREVLSHLLKIHKKSG